MAEKRKQRKPRLKTDQLLNLVALQSKSSPNTVKKILDATYYVILKQLELNGEIWFSQFGTFKLINSKARDHIMGDPINGGTQLRYIPEHNRVSFDPSDKFRESINSNFEVPVMKKSSRKKKKDCGYQKVPAPTIEEVMVDALSISQKRSEGNIGKLWS